MLSRLQDVVHDTEESLPRFRLAEGNILIRTTTAAGMAVTRTPATEASAFAGLMLPIA